MLRFQYRFQFIFQKHCIVSDVLPGVASKASDEEGPCDVVFPAGHAAKEAADVLVVLEYVMLLLIYTDFRTFTNVFFPPSYIRQKASPTFSRSKGTHKRIVNVLLFFVVHPIVRHSDNAHISFCHSLEIRINELSL